MRELDAVNVTLEALGESRIVDLNTSNPSAGLARSALERKRTAALATGWWFNTVYKTATPATSGMINVPWAQLALYGLDGTKYGERDGVLYDLVEQTKIFTESVSLKVIIDIEFQDLPEYMAQWLAYSTAAEVYMNDLGSDSNYQGLEQRAAELYSLFYREHLRNMQYSSAKTRTAARIRRGFRI